MWPMMTRSAVLCAAARLRARVTITVALATLSGPSGGSLVQPQESPSEQSALAAGGPISPGFVRRAIPGLQHLDLETASLTGHADLASYNTVRTRFEVSSELPAELVVVTPGLSHEASDLSYDVWDPVTYELRFLNGTAWARSPSKPATALTLRDVEDLRYFSHAIPGDLPREPVDGEPARARPVPERDCTAEDLASWPRGHLTEVRACNPPLAFLPDGLELLIRTQPATGPRGECEPRFYLLRVVHRYMRIAQEQDDDPQTNVIAPAYDLVVEWKPIL